MLTLFEHRLIDLAVRHSECSLLWLFVIRSVRHSGSAFWLCILAVRHNTVEHVRQSAGARKSSSPDYCEVL